MIQFDSLFSPVKTLHHLLHLQSSSSVHDMNMLRVTCYVLRVTLLRVTCYVIGDRWWEYPPPKYVCVMNSDEQVSCLWKTLLAKKSLTSHYITVKTLSPTLPTLLHFQNSFRADRSNFFWEFWKSIFLFWNRFQTSETKCRKCRKCSG